MLPLRNISPATDDELLLSFKQSGSQETLAQLYLRYTDMVYGVCMKYLKDGEAAKDAVMNIYTELVQKLPQHEVEHFRSWLYVLVKNHCLMQLRREKKMMTVEITQPLVQSEDFSHLDTVLEKESDFKRLEDCMQRLPAEQKKTIELFYMENKCYNEIAEQTGLEWNKVRSMIQNGRRNLKICMDKNG
ncbi:MAG TPA: sigma-70 family RNA polymerase sigma factor [Chitinophagaceae bacterium]|nr:sigma-70 family RNA polymerase sigma factor [Chitinophagaceae bacterium]